MTAHPTSPGPEAGEGPRFDACMTALRGWRDRLVGEGKLPVGAIKDAHLQRAVTRGRRDEREVARMLPSASAKFAGAIVNVIMTVDAASPPSISRSAGVQPMAAPPAPPARSAPSAATGAPAPGVAPPPPQPAPPPVAPVAAPATPAPAPEKPEVQAVDKSELAASFAALDYTEPVGDPGPLKISLQNRGLVVSWSPAAQPGQGQHVVYRVVSSEDHPAYAPEWAELVDVTEGLSALDARPVGSATRFFQVWCNTGADRAEALAAQPTLHAQGVIVAPVQDLHLGEDGGRIIGHWWVFPGITRVHVHRVPVERAAQGSGDLQYRIATQDPNLSGFIDRDAVRGKNYLYQFFTEATVEDLARLSPPVNRPLAVSAVLDAVEDLSVRGHGAEDQWQFDLRWSAPAAGRVVVYRTSVPPTPGLENGTHEESALPAGALTVEMRLAHPTHQNADGTVGMEAVPAPEGWDRVYFTPVTLLNGRARVGRSASQVVIPDIATPVIVERTDHQLLKFGWPGEAAAVAVDVGAPGQPPTAPVVGGPHYEEISREQYRRLGGLQFRHRLPANGCSVHLVGVSFVGGYRFNGQPTMLEYPGLLRLGYVVETRRSLLYGPDRMTVRVWAERELTNCPPLVLVHNPERLPLHIGDGEPLPVSLDIDGAPAPQPRFRPERLAPTPGAVAWRTSVRGRSGFVRLFLDVPPEVMQRVALLDPPVGSLNLRS